MEVSLTKYPIVLVHGMLLKDFKLYRAFRKIKKILKENGVNVYVTNQDGVGSITNNAMQLKEEINEILKKENVDKVNIIAHSKGGLDARYMISKLNMDDKVASLTTLSTPHHGSKMSAKILKLPKWFAKFIAFFINLFYKIFNDKNPDILTLGYELTDAHMQEFNEEVTNSSKVYYQSYSSNIDKQASFLMFIPHKFSKYCEDDHTDGIVSVNSSKWGEYRGHTSNNFHHIHMVGVSTNKKKTLEVAQFYMDIIKGLFEMGF